jgi:hypothetical protein
MSGERVGGVDDPVWLTAEPTTPPAPRHRLRNVLALLAVFGLPAIAVVIRGFDWVAMVAGIAGAVLALVLLYRKLVGPLLVGVVLLVAAFAVLELDNGITFHTLALNEPPSGRIHWCGRDYDGGSPTSEAPQVTRQEGSLHLVTVAPSGTAVYAVGNCEPGRQFPMELYAKIGSGRWVFYGLSGGP